MERAIKILIRLIPVIAIVALAIIIRLIQRCCYSDLFSISAPKSVTIWPGTVVFGFYFATLFFSVRKIFPVKTTPTLTVLGLIAVSGLAGDLVFVNIKEAYSCLPARYGAVVIWDIFSLFIIWAAIEPHNPRSAMDPSSFAVVAFPAMKVGREILYMASFSGLTQSTVDFYVADLGLLLSWCALCIYVGHLDSGTNWKNERFGRLLGSLVLLFGTYWIIAVLGHAIELGRGSALWPSTTRLNAVIILLSILIGFVVFPKLSRYSSNSEDLTRNKK